VLQSTSLAANLDERCFWLWGMEIAGSSIFLKLLDDFLEVFLDFDVSFITEEIPNTGFRPLKLMFALESLLPV
jgi:hypothetical protein